MSAAMNTRRNQILGDQERQRLVDKRAAKLKKAEQKAREKAERDAEKKKKKREAAAKKAAKKKEAEAPEKKTHEPAFDADNFDIDRQKHRGQYALRKLYHESPRPLVVMYTSPTCGPCKRLKPMLNKVLNEYEESVHYVEIDIAEDPEIAESAGIMGTPCVQVFKDKARVAVVNGVKMKSEYRKIFSEQLIESSAA